MKYNDSRKIPDTYYLGEPCVKIFNAEKMTTESAKQCDRGYSSRNSTTSWSQIDEEVNEWISDYFGGIRILSIEYVDHSVMIVYHKLFYDESYDCRNKGEHDE